MKTLLWFAIAALVATYIATPVADPDLWWHITVGRWIVAHRDVPHVDYWNMFGVGGAWRAYSWSSEIVVALVDRYAGELGLLSLELALAALLAISLQLTFSLVSKDWFVGTLLGVYGAVACFNHFTLRPQVLVWIFFAILLSVVAKVSQKETSRFRYCGYLVLIGAAWANTHLTAAIGLASIVLYLLPKDLKNRTELETMITCAVAFFVGTLCTPYLGGEWITFIKKSGHPLKYSMIAEFQPATILQYSTIFVLLGLVFLTVCAFASRIVPTFGRAVLAGGMVMAGLTAVKFLPFAAIVLCSLIASWWREYSFGSRQSATSNRGLPEAIALASSQFNRLAPSTYGALAFFVIAVSASNVTHLMRKPVDWDYAPQKGVDFILEKKLPKPLLNEFGTGGYLMYRFSDQQGEPSQLVAIDGRTNVNPPEVWQMYQESLLGKLGWRRFIEKIGANTVMWRQGSPLVSLLFASKEWCRVFSSGTKETDYVIFVKRDKLLTLQSEFTSLNCIEINEHEQKNS